MMFEGIEATIFGLAPNKRLNLTDAISKNGGSVRYVPGSHTTHIVCTDEYMKTNAKRLKAHVRNGVKVVSPAFFTESVRLGARQPEAAFFIALPQKKKEEGDDHHSASNGDTTPSPAQSSSSRSFQYRIPLASPEQQQQPEAIEPAESDAAPKQTTTAAEARSKGPIAKKEAKWRTARVFISSTFRDMHGERDYLTRYVFPELQERCNKLRVHVTPVDLRWGVTEDQTQQALEICLNEIDNCRPFFVGLLGKRYGWCPNDYTAPDEQRFDWLRTIPSGYSITHIEMLYGVLRDASKARGFFYFRDPGFERSLPGEHKANYQAESVDSERRMEVLKDEIREKCPTSFFDYPCSWRGIVDGKPMVGELEKFGERVLEDLWQAMIAEFPEDVTEKDPLAQARAYHEGFIETHARQFVGRTAILQQIHGYADLEEPTPCVVIGEPGGGKSSLVAAFAREYNARHKAEGDVVIPHFVGAAPGSTNIRHTLDRLGSELKLVVTHAAQCHGLTVEQAVAKFCVKVDSDGSHGNGDVDGDGEGPSTTTKEDGEDEEGGEEKTGRAEDYKSVEQNFLRNLERASALLNSLPILNSDDASSSANPGRHRKLVLVIDALNQLDTGYNAHSLNWLPKELPKGLRLIVSTLPGECLDVLKRRLRVEVPVGALTQEERKEIVRKTLGEYRKQLDNRQMNKLLAKKDAYKPLYLIVACEELRVFGVYERVSEFIDQMPETVPSLFEEVLARLEKDHGLDLVRSALSLLECSRGGILEVEMVQLLSSAINADNLEPTEKAFTESLKNGTANMPSSLWLRLYRSLKPYLRPSGDSGEGILDFFHQQLSFAVHRRYLDDKFDARSMYRATHSRLANYFQYLADPNGDLSWGSCHHRGMSETPFHQTEAGMLASLENTICDLGFIETKCALGMTYDLVADFLAVRLVLDDAVRRRLVTPDQAKRLLQFQRFIQARAYVLAQRPELAFSLAANLPDSSAPAAKATERWLAGKEGRPWFKWTNKPQVPDPCIMTLAGHTMVVRKCVYSPAADSHRILSSSDDKTLKIFDSRTGAEIASLGGHNRSVLCCAYSLDGKRIVSSTWKAEIKVWNAETNVELTTILGHKGAVHQVLFSPDGRYIVSAGQDKTVRVHNSYTYAPVATLTGHTDSVNTVACSPCGTYLVSGSADNTLRKWSTGTWGPVQTITGHRKPINRCAFSNDGTLLASSSDDRTVIVWTCPGGSGISSDSSSISATAEDAADSIRELRTLRGPNDGAVGVAFSPDGKRVAASSHDNVVYIWEARTGATLATLTGHTGSVFDCAFSSDGSNLVTCSFDRTVKVWECPPTEDEEKDEDSEISGSADPSKKPARAVVRRPARRAAEPPAREGHSARILGCAFSPDGKFAATASRDKSLRLWNVQSGKEIAVLGTHRSNVFACGWSPDSQQVVSASRDSTVKIWTAGVGTPGMNRDRGYAGTHKGVVFDCAWAPNGARIVSASEDKSLRIWSADNMHQVGTLYGHRDKVYCCAYSPDGRRIVSGSADGSLKLWDTARNSKVATFNGHTKGVTCCTFSPDSLRVVSGGEDAKLIEWNAKNAQRLATWTGHTATITAVAFTRNGRYIVSGSTDNTILVWLATTKAEVCAYTCLSRITALDTSPEGLSIAVGDGAGQFYVFTPVGLIGDEPAKKKAAAVEYKNDKKKDKEVAVKKPQSTTTAATKAGALVPASGTRTWASVTRS